MGKCNQDKLHSFNNGLFVPYEHFENENTSRKLKADRFSLFIQEEIEDQVDPEIQSAIETIENERIQRLQQFKQQQDLENEDMLVNATSELSTTEVASTLPLVFGEDGKNKVMLKILVKEEDIKAHQLLTRAMPGQPALELESLLEMKQCRELQNGIEATPIAAANPKVATMYRRLGGYLSQYRSGRLPRSFKIIPMLKNWEEILLLTQPQSWSPQAMYEGTKAFMSIHKAHLQNFIQCVLMPYTRTRIRVHGDGHLEYPLFLAFKLVLLKSRTFTLGCLLPLCQSKESNWTQVSVLACVAALANRLKPAPILWSLMTLPFSIPATLFILIALERKKSFPLSFYSPLAHYFIRAREALPRSLPPIWYQAMLRFIPLCGSELDKKQMIEFVKIVRFQPKRVTGIVLRLQMALMTFLPQHQPEDFDSLSDDDEGLTIFNEEILSDSDIESSDQSSDEDNYGADNDGGDDSDDDDLDFITNDMLLDD